MEAIRYNSCKKYCYKPVKRQMAATSVLTLFLLFLSLYFCQIGRCVPAVQMIKQLEQPNGNSFTAKLWGDEEAHGWETLEGFAVIKDPVTKFWCFAVMDETSGLIKPGMIVGLEKGDDELQTNLRPMAVHQQISGIRRFEQKHEVGIDRAPVTGSKQLPVMMVNFSDKNTTYDSTDFQNLLFDTGNKSMKDFYEEVSYGAFTVTPGTAGVTGWYTSAKTHDYYGENDSYGYDKYSGELVIEVVTAADATIDFSEYDTDGDCYVDVVVIIHQGSGEEAGGPTTDIWSHQWELDDAVNYGDGSGAYTTNDSGPCGTIIIDKYIIQPEMLLGQIQTVGVFAHEYGHCLGLPDLYDTDGSSGGIGNWGLMSGGAWGGVDRPGDSPVHLCAWSKYVLGWINPLTVTDRLLEESIDPVAGYADVYRFFPGNQTDSEEYYLVENRQQIGFDEGLSGTGLAIWHIDDNMASNTNIDNSAECSPSEDCTDTHYRVTLVQADGDWDLEKGRNSGDTGDLYPGTSENTYFTHTSDPANLCFDGSSSNVNISDISVSQSTIKATLALVYTITPSVDGGGNITPGGKSTADHGDNVTLTITPNAGYQVQDVLVDGTTIGAVNEYTFSNIQLDHTINAVFTSNVSSTAGAGSGGGGCFISSSLHLK